MIRNSLKQLKEEVEQRKNEGKLKDLEATKNAGDKPKRAKLSDTGSKKKKKVRIRSKGELDEVEALYDIFGQFLLQE